jgi:ABC-type methionine transport system ATPase subunit
MNDRSIFTLSGVTQTRAGSNLLDNINLTVADNDFLAILGPSGSGKTTLLRLLNCLDSPSTGSIEYQDRPLEDLEITNLRKNIGMVFQTPVLIKGTVRDNLNITRRWDKTGSIYTDKKLSQLLETVGLTAAFLDKDARSLSGGECQRVAMAQVLLNRPRVLLLDEPTANLDPQLGRLILKTIRHIYKEYKLTVIMVSHDQRLAREFSQRIIFLFNGRIGLETTADKLNAIDIRLPAINKFLKGETE